MNIKNDVVYFVPLGGANEIGMNLNLYGYNNNWIIIDMGIMFAGDGYPGVDVIVPDTVFLDSIINDIKAIFITHSHEDHLGGVPYLAYKFNCPIYLTEFASKLLEKKMFYTEYDDALFIKKVKYKKAIKIGPFEVIYSLITHSVPESSLLSISVNNKHIVHSGDWKIDNNPLVGGKTDINFLKKLSQKGVDVLVCDSTNVFNQKSSGSEGDVRKSLLKIIKNSPSNRIYVTTFASNVARLSSLIHIAEKLKIKICVMGGSLQRALEIARNCGYINKISNLVNVSEIPRNEKTIILCTGCQGEPRAALSRIAFDHHQLKFNGDDLVIFSSKIIPGNEKKISSIINKITRLGVEVITEKDQFVHVSGHPGREELLFLYNLLKPYSVIPVHGEARHIKEHTKFAKESGIKTSLEVNNGDVVNLSSKVIFIESTVPSGKLLVDGNQLILPESEVIKHRYRIKDNGIIFINIIKYEGKKSPRKILISSAGVINDETELENMLLDDISKSYKLGLVNKKNEELIIRQSTNRVLKKITDKKPKVIIKIFID